MMYRIEKPSISEQRYGIHILYGTRIFSFSPYVRMILEIKMMTGRGHFELWI
jgi:hypothetical protein